MKIIFNEVSSILHFKTNTDRPNKRNATKQIDKRETTTVLFGEEVRAANTTGG